MEENREVYIDANIFIFAYINEDPIGELSSRFLELIINGKVNAYTSTLTFDELFWKTKRERNRELALESARLFLNMPNLRFIEPTTEILWSAYDLLMKYNLGPRDAIHIASALAKNIPLVLSEDSDFDKVKEIKRISLNKFKLKN